MNKKPDIFDKIMHLPVLNVFELFYKKHKEVLMYLFFGGWAFFLNIGLFAAIDTFGVNELINNIVCWGICVLFQFFTNRTWVFDGHVDNSREFIKQMGSFISGRIGTLVIEEIILAIFITWLGMNSVVIKLIAQIVIIALNYIISKLIVFKN